MKKLSKSQQSKKNLDHISNKKTKQISKSMQQKLDEAGSETNETIVSIITPAEKFVASLEKRKNPHLRDYVSLSEKTGTIENYSEYQEQRDLENYKRFIQSFAYDDIKEVEEEIGKTLTLTNLRKISSMHDD